MAGRLEGKVAVITGGASGIGLATVELFVGEGAHVVVADIQDEKGRDLEVRWGDRVRYAHCDVSREDDVSGAIGLADRVFGGLDILFNNAGHAGLIAPIVQTNVEGWDNTFAVLVRGPMLGIKHAAPLMERRGGGSIINTASVAAFITGGGPPAYSAAKAAVVQLSKVAAAELARKRIRVNALSPGLTATALFGASFGMGRLAADQMAAQIEQGARDFQPIPRAGLPIDLAEAALFLGSDASSFVTGTQLVVDGGVSIGPPSSWDPDLPPPFLVAMGVKAEEIGEVMQTAVERSSSGRVAG